MENKEPATNETKKPTKMEELQMDYARTCQRIGDIEVLVENLDSQKASLMGQARQIKIAFDNEMKKANKPKEVKKDENDKTV